MPGLSFRSFDKSSVTLGSWAITVPPNRQSSKVSFMPALALYRIFLSCIMVFSFVNRVSFFWAIISLTHLAVEAEMLAILNPKQTGSGCPFLPSSASSFPAPLLPPFICLAMRAVCWIAARNRSRDRGFCSTTYDGLTDTSIVVGGNDTAPPNSNGEKGVD